MIPSPSTEATDGRLPARTCCASFIPGATIGGDRVQHAPNCGIQINGRAQNCAGRSAFAARAGFKTTAHFYAWIDEKFGGSFDGVVVYDPAPPSDEERFRVALEHELALAEKQVELLKLRVEEGGHDHVKPFGTDAWKRVERLRAVLRHNSELSPPKSQ